MEYRKDKRTKNLTLHDIHVGDWVQVWSEQAERYSPPLKIIQICDDGTIYLVTSDEERCTPWEEDIKNVDALPIDADLLRGFGFSKLSLSLELARKMLINSGSVCEHEIFKLKNFPLYVDLVEHAAYKMQKDYCHKIYYNNFNDLQHNLFYWLPDINFEWKGVEK